ncbi:VOC family protein [Caldalkalibacillus mannanilyticus]|uniref:VOC family protein n=1 Tax=Caldalkalibacillus mannanilyticus TaxID=1418 RepID=UPI0004681C6F|nr:VOC family protein [Caldalkalibacillus mannanilyticus]
MSILFKRIDTVFLRVKNFEEAINWYTNILGFELRWKEDVGGYAALNISETPLTLVREDQEKFVPSASAHFNFYVENAEEAHQYLLKNDVEVGPIEKDGEVQWFWFKDPEGNRLEICSFPESLN